MVGMYMNLGSSKTGQSRSQLQLPLNLTSYLAVYCYDMLRGCCAQEMLRQCVVMGRVWNRTVYVCKEI